MKKDGTFQHCTNCTSNPRCCSNFNKINAPVLNKIKLEKIKRFVGKNVLFMIIVQMKEILLK